MMCHRNANGRVNVKLLTILIVLVAAIGTSLVVARQVRRRALSERALAAGQTAFEKQDWQAAVTNFGVYLGRNPDDLPVLRKYAESVMSTRPRDGQAVTQMITQAISAYRHIMRLDPHDGTASEQLAKLYRSVLNFEELIPIAKTRMEHDPNDLNAPLWLAEAQIRLNKLTEARGTLEAFIRRLETVPGTHIEYVRACMQMSMLAADPNLLRPTVPGDAPQSPPPADGSEPAGQPTPVEWLDKAVAYAPTSAEALVYRARFWRLRATGREVSDSDKSKFLATARRDLDAADALGTDNPRIRLVLAEEWMDHGELDRVDAELRAADELPGETGQEGLFGLNDQGISRFRLRWELAMRRGAAAEAAALVDETLALPDMQDRGAKALVLPCAIQVYVTVGRTADARRCLDEYLEKYQAVVQAQQAKDASARAIAVLKAMVEGAENKPYAVIDLLGPLVGDGPNAAQILRMLSRAYESTGQTARAVNALEQYLRLNPQDRQARRDLAKQYATSADFEKAFDVSRDMEASDPTDIGLKMMRIGAGISRAVGRGQDAAAPELAALSTELSELRQQYPDRVDIRVFQSIIATKQGQPEQAERELKQAIEECKEPLKAELQLIRHYTELKRADDAIAVCEAACKRHEGVAEPWVALSRLYVMREDYDSARRSLQRGLDAVTDSRIKSAVSIELAILEMAHGDRAAGIGLLQQLTTDPQEIRARLLLLGTREIREDRSTAERLVGELRQAEGQSGLWWRLHQASLWLSDPDASAKQKEIATLLEHCINADPTWPAPVLLLAGAYATQGDASRAEEVYRRGLLANPSSAEIGDRLLALLTQQGRYADGEKVLRQIQNPQIVTNWQARLAVGRGDFSRAIDELQLKVRNDKDRQDADSRVELARLLYQETKDAGQAMRYLDEAKAIKPDSRVLTAVKASILRADGKQAQAEKALDDYVADYNSFDAYWLRAVYRAEAGETERAEQDYRKLTTFTDRAAVGYDLVGGFYAGAGRLDQGVAAVEEGLRAYPEDARLKRRLMRLLLSRAQGQDRDNALAILADLESKLPQDTELLMIRATQILGDPSLTPQQLAIAREKLEDVVKREPTVASAHLALIGIAMQERQYQTACNLAVRALASNPDNPALLVARARAELMLGYSPMAAKLARQALQDDPNSTEALDVFTQAALLSRDPGLLEEARTLMEVYCQTEEGRGSVKAAVTLADLYRSVGNTAKAEEIIGRLEQSNPTDQVVVHARFLLLASMKRFDEMGQLVLAYISAKGQDLAMVRSAASILISQQSPQLKTEGVKLLQHAVSTWPTSVEARRDLASGLYQAGDAEASEKAYRALLDQNRNDIQALNDLAWILQERFARYDEALELANQGIRIAPTDVHLLDTKGTILSKMPGRLADAKNSFEQIVGLSRADPRRLAMTHLQLGRVCTQLNDSAQAKRHLEDAQEIDRTRNVLTAQERSEIARLLEGLSSPPAP
ncbi:MAG: tetratricopeptide repeat protein [Phycisphaerales bacterium]